MHPAAKHATEHAWQKTGRTAPKEHHDGLSPELWVEFVGLDDDGKTQGRVLAYLTAEGGRTKHGNIFVGHVIAAEDEYYAYWLDSSFGAYRVDRRVLMHFIAFLSHPWWTLQGRNDLQGCAARGCLQNPGARHVGEADLDEGRGKGPPHFGVAHIAQATGPAGPTLGGGA